MYEVLILFLLPMFLATLFYQGLKFFKSQKERITISVIMAFFYLILVIALLIEIPGYKNPGVHNAVITFLLTALAIAISTTITMNTFTGIFAEKYESLQAFLTPLISVPFIFALFLGGEVWQGRLYGSFFTAKLPLIGFIIDIFTKNRVFGDLKTQFWSGLILYVGFFIEMTLVMLIIYWYLKACTNSNAEKYD